MRDEIAALPDGEYSATPTIIDGFGDDPQPIRFAGAPRHRGRRVRRSISTGTSPPGAGGNQLPDRHGQFGAPIAPSAASARPTSPTATATCGRSR